MIVHNDLKYFTAAHPVVTIGTFDGVHLGHRKVIERLKEIARSMEGETVLFTFSPHPRLIVSPAETNLRLLTTLAEKEELLKKAGIDHFITYPFTLEFSQLSNEEFVEKILVERIKTCCLVVGYDHKFGKNRQGDFSFLKKCSAKYHFRLEKLEALMDGDFHISSSRIRNALQEGDIKKANRMLGYEYMLHGRVVEGEHLGSTIGFPTANIESSDIHKLIPAYGVYAVRVKTGEKFRNGMMNIGTRPTFNHNADQRSIEVNIFDFSDNIYGQEITLFFVDKIRDEQKFAGKDDLVEQLKADRITALKILDSPAHFFFNTHEMGM